MSFKLTILALAFGAAAAFLPARDLRASVKASSRPTWTQRNGVSMSATATGGKRAVSLDMYRNIGIMAHIDAGERPPET